ncbi:MAG TPA: CHAD domain-containing protein [Vicinamibacterales bacterium]|nr:CHAD domain-containing protein [Vicinamibacterales bacterium]
MATRRSPAPEFLLRQRIAALKRMLPGTRTGDVRATHHARVATRRLRAAVPLLGAGKAGRRLASAARELTRVIGPVRELDVAHGLLDELKAAGQVSNAAVSYLRTAIADERRALHREMVRSVEECDLDRLQRKTLGTLERRSSRKHHVADRHDQLASVRRRAARRAARLEAAVDVAGSIYLPERLHDVRIAVKKLRYVLEIVRDLSGSRAERRIQTLKRTQDLLGRLHDFEVLITRTRALQAAAVRDLRLSSDLDQLVRYLETECRKLHGQYITMRRTLLDICRRVETAGERYEAAS